MTQAKEEVKWVSRQARRFLSEKPYYEALIEYESDLFDLCKCHHSWVSGEKDLTEKGLRIRKYLLENPELINE